MANPRIDCGDVTYNAVPIIGKLYSRQQIDSIYLFLDYWKDKCFPMPMEPILRLRNILDIRTGRFDTDSINGGLIELLMLYRKGLDTRPYYYDYWYPQAVDDAAAKKAYDSLTQRIASETLTTNTDEALVLDFYSRPSPTFENIRTTPQPARLKSVYHEVYSRALAMPLFHIALITGAIQTQGNLSVFGTRPNFGMAMGSKWMRNNLDLLLEIRAGPSKERYSFVYQDSLITHDKWTGGYVGIEYTFDFIETNKISVGLSPGLGYDWITAREADEDNDEDAVSLPAFNQNAGLVLKYKFGKAGGYVGLHLRYNSVRYKNPGGTPLDGGYFNVRLTIGSIFDQLRMTRLKNLE
jgi:hypothetical protein